MKTKLIIAFLTLSLTVFAGGGVRVSPHVPEPVESHSVVHENEEENTTTHSSEEENSHLSSTENSSNENIYGSSGKGLYYIVLFNQRTKRYDTLSANSTDELEDKANRDDYSSGIKTKTVLWIGIGFVAIIVIFAATIIYNDNQKHD